MDMSVVDAEVGCAEGHRGGGCFFQAARGVEESFGRGRRWLSFAGCAKMEFEVVVGEIPRMAM